MLDSIYHMTLRYIENLISDIKVLYIFNYVHNIVMGVITFTENL